MFELPKRLLQLIDTGVWPTGYGTQSVINGQALDPIVGKTQARRISPTADTLILMPYPFHTIADEVRGGNLFWVRDLTNYGEIDYSKAVIIADFGLGADSVLILYYDDPTSPKVMYLKWSWDNNKVGHAWKHTHDSFDDFVAAIGLEGR
jgi:hypothetical protein